MRKKNGLVIYVHGKGGNANEAKHFKPLFFNCDVVGFEYNSQNPWEAKIEFSSFYDSYSEGYDYIILIANSIGAFLSMYALEEKNISKSFFISPIVNMEKLILDMMQWENIGEDELKLKKEIPTTFGETLSWEYLSYVKQHPIKWNKPTYILYGDKDNLTSLETISTFANKINASLTVMKNGEHYFNTKEEMDFLDNWIIGLTRN